MRRLRPSRVVLALFALCGCQAEVASGLDATQASEVVRALDQAGVGAEREGEPGQGDAYRVMVPRGEVPTALATLAALDLPREPPAGFDSFFAESGLVPSATEERARYAAALGGELARSIETLRGVWRARVHVALPDPSARPLDEGPAHPRVSVLVQHAAGDAPDERAIRDLIAGAVQDLQRDDITVVLEARAAEAPPTAQLTRVGPIAVSHGTASLLKAILAGSFALNLLLIAVLAWMRRRPSAPVPTDDTTP